MIVRPPPPPSSPNERPQAHNTVTGEKRQRFNYYYLLLGQLIRLNMPILFGSINAYLGSRTLKHKAHYTKHLGNSPVDSNEKVRRSPSDPTVTKKFQNIHNETNNPASTRNRWPGQRALSGPGSGLGRPERFRAARSGALFFSFSSSFPFRSFFPLRQGGITISPDPLCL